MFGKSKQSGKSSHTNSNHARSNVEASSSTRRATKNCGSKRTEAGKSSIATKNCGGRKSCGSHSNKKSTKACK